MIPTRLLVNEDNLIRWDGVILASAGTYINSGTGSWELKDADDNVIASGSLSYVSASNGRWHGTIDKNDVTEDDVTLGETYYLELTLTNGSGTDGFRRIALKAEYHGSV